MTRGIIPCYEHSLYKTVPSLLNRLIIEQKATAKEYLKKYLGEEDLSVLSHLMLYAGGHLYLCIGISLQQS